MTVSRICVREIDTCEISEPVHAAAERMGARNVGTLVAIDHTGRPVGLVTDRDLVIKVMALGRDPDRTPVGDVMSSSIKTVQESTPIEEALMLMRSARIRRLPVVDRDGALVGVLSLDDVLQLLAEEFKSIGRILQQAHFQGLAHSHRN